MGVSRGRVAEQALHHDLAGRRIEQVSPPHHFAHPRLRVIHHHRKLVGKQAIGTQQHEITHIGGHILFDQALHPVLETDPTRGHPQAPGTGLTAHR